MAKIKQQHIRAFILGQFMDEPRLKPPMSERMEHAGTLYSTWKRTMGGKPPAYSRIDKALRDLTAEGVLRPARCPYGTPVYMLGEPGEIV